uniref:Uncharacterized protein n=1 Tax=Ciona intestinalis TaxID=7719 RepID=H2XWL9_CIOIN
TGKWHELYSHHSLIQVLVICCKLSGICIDYTGNQMQYPVLSSNSARFPKKLDMFMKSFV